MTRNISAVLSAVLLSMLPTAGYSAQTLSEAIELVYTKHPQVLQSAAEYDESVERIDVAKAAYLPSLNVTGDAGYEVVDNSTTRARGDENEIWSRSQVGLELRQELFSGYHTFHEVARTEHFAKARQLELAALREDLTLAGVQAYLDVLRQRARFDLAERNLESHEEIFRQIRTRVDRGVGTRSDLAQISSRLNSANANFLTAENNLIDAETDYERVIGELPEEILEGVTIEEERLPESLEDAEEVVFKLNPTVKASLVDINEARSQYARTRSSFMPEVDFVMNANYGENVSGTEGKDESYSAMLELRWNLFNGGGDSAERRAAGYQVEQARAVNLDAARQALQGLKLSWSAYEVLGRQRAFLENYVRSAEATRDAYRKEFKLGKRTLIDLLDSENEVLRSTNEYIEADFDFEASKARILNALGQLSAVVK